MESKCRVRRYICVSGLCVLSACVIVCEIKSTSHNVGCCLPCLCKKCVGVYFVVCACLLLSVLVVGFFKVSLLNIVYLKL